LYKKAIVKLKLFFGNTITNQCKKGKNGDIEATVFIRFSLAILGWNNHPAFVT